MRPLRCLRLFAVMQAQNMQSKMEYKLDFVLGNITTVVGQAVGIAFVWVIFQRIGDLRGWTLPQVMLIYGVAALPYGVFELLFNGVWYLNGHVRMGTLDTFMTRPMGPLFFVLCEASAPHCWGNVVTGAAIIVLASVDLGLRWTAGSVAFLLLTTACGVAIYLAINMITATMSFWFPGMRSSIMYMVQRFRDFSRYPVDIYSLPIRILLTWVVPFAFTGFFPATFLLRREEYALFVALIPAMAAAFLAIAWGFWRLGLRRYESTGS